MILSDSMIRHSNSPSCEARKEATRRNANAAVRVLIGLAFVFLFIVVAQVEAQTVVGSRHDLSTTAPSDRVCAFCHTPHTGNTDVVAPLWNRFVDLTTVFTTYTSPTMNTVPGQPTLTISGVCLGCHDGTVSTAVVNGNLGNTKHDLVNAPIPDGMPGTNFPANCRNCHGELYGDPPADWQGTDLSNDHPITMTYPTPAQDAAYRVPPDLTNGWSDVALFNGRVECPSCHDVHDPTIVPFLTRTNVASQLCLTCHIK
ncbi:MAG: cytochrome c3 family protein [bacterium]|nr:cytochrome c3 family protein [bacterium]